jgi:hypothetical protein
MSNTMNHNEGDRNGRQDVGQAAGRPGDDLLWTAYQYTADELPEPAARAFEASLETDQQAREALAEAVSLADTVRASLCPERVAAPAVMPATVFPNTVFSNTVIPDTVMPASVVAASMTSDRASYGWAGNSYGWAAAWVALGAAACLVLTFALRNNSPVDAPAPIAQHPAAKTDAGTIKTDGSATRTDGLADQQLLAVLFPEGSAAQDAVVTDGSDAADAASIDSDTGSYDEAAYEPMPEATAPDWLLAAVAEAGAPANE